MSDGLAFVDTNVFAYALDGTNPAKQARAQELIGDRRDAIVISAQVLLELHAVCRRKLGMSRADASAAVGALSDLSVVDTDRALVLDAMRLAEGAQLSIFDATLICAAQRASCGVILTEDLNAGQTFGDVLVVNPFADPR